MKPTELVPLEGEMPKVDDRHLTKPYNTLFLAMTDKSLTRNNVVVGGGGVYNSVARCDVNTGKYVHWCAGPDTALHEVAFCPRSLEGMSKEKTTPSIRSSHVSNFCCS